MSLTREEGDEVVCLCIELTDKNEQDVYLWEHIIAFLEDEGIEAEAFWENNPEERTHTPAPL